MKSVEINGIVFKLAYNLKSLFTYEEITGHPYKGDRTIDIYLLMYSMLIANNNDFSMDFDEFIGKCDEDYTLYQTFVEVMEDESKRMSAFKDSKKKVMIQ